MMIENIEVTMYLYDIYHQDMNTLVLFMVLKGCEYTQFHF